MNTWTSHTPNHWAIKGNQHKEDMVVLGSSYFQDRPILWVLRRPSFARVTVTKDTLGFRAFLTTRTPR